MDSLTAIHLCSGYGGFELALRSVARVRTVAHVERDAYAAAVLVARMEGAQLDHAPIWDDVSTFDGRPWCGRVDIITAGFPCQPFSAAGAKRGIVDDRWLWPEIARIVGEVGPRFVILENVPQLVRHGLPEVLDDLAELGFDAEWGLLSASAVGAPHKRQRWWCLAYADRDGFSSLGREPADNRDTWHDVDRPGSAHVADTDSDRLRRQRLPLGEPVDGTEAERGSEDVGDAESVRCGTRQRPDTDQRQSRRTDTQVTEHRFPPRPDDLDGWQQWDGAQPSLRRSPDGAPRWLADRLHLGGNGLVPQCATEAIQQLHNRSMT